MNNDFRYDRHEGPQRQLTSYWIQALTAILLTAISSTQATAADLKEERCWRGRTT